ncbi:MAG: hypothetical protein LC785_06940 [Acidobacteria bacterium]|nr:hypothetical protein [Acidobacteriota bacterium]MCA1641672.1 hypothetical protein [Acidobacteriota bacterium]
MEIKEAGLADRKKKFVMIVLFVLSFLLSMCMTIHAQECKEGPYTKKGIEESLKKYTTDKDKQFMIDEIKKCGVDFQLTERDILDFCKARADYSLIEAVRDNYAPIKLCASVQSIIIAVVPENSLGDAQRIRDALRKIGCKARDPKTPDNPPDVENEPPIALRYFDKSEASIAKALTNYLKKETNITLEPKFEKGNAKLKGTLEIWIIQEIKKE